VRWTRSAVLCAVEVCVEVIEKLTSGATMSLRSAMHLGNFGEAGIGGSVKVLRAMQEFTGFVPKFQSRGFKDIQPCPARMHPVQ